MTMIEVPITVTLRIGVAGQGPVREVELNATEQPVVTVREILAANNVVLGPNQTVSVNGTVVDPDHVIELGAIDPSAVPVVLVAPRVNNG